MSGTMIVSPWAAYATTALLDSEKALIRQYCGYPPFGTGASGFQNWRFFQQDGLLEFRMSNFAPAEFQAIRGYVTNIIALEAAIPGVSANLDTDSASVWFHNKNELKDRRALYEYWRQELLTLVGVPAGPYKGSSGGTITLVV